jgi:hypothetical protein
LHGSEDKYLEGPDNFGEDLKNHFGLTETKEHHRNILQRWRSRAGSPANNPKKDISSEGMRPSEGTADAALWNVQQRMRVVVQPQPTNEGQHIPGKPVI